MLLQLSILSLVKFVKDSMPDKSSSLVACINISVSIFFKFSIPLSCLKLPVFILKYFKLVNLESRERSVSEYLPRKRCSSPRQLKRLSALGLQKIAMPFR